MVLSEGTFTSVSIDKKLKRSLKNSRNKGFLTFFASEFLNWEATTGGHYVSLSVKCGYLEGAVLLREPVRRAARLTKLLHGPGHGHPVL
jgi:hypothetical protein